MGSQVDGVLAISISLSAYYFLAVRFLFIKVGETVIPSDVLRTYMRA